MDNKYIGVIIGAAVAIIVIGSLLAPVVLDVTAKSDVMVNDGYYRLGEVPGEGTHTIEWVATSPSVITYDGQDYDLSKNFVKDGSTLAIIGSATCGIRMYASSDHTLWRLESLGSPAGYLSVDSGVATNSATITITDNDGTLVVNKNGEEVTRAYGVSATPYFCPMVDGDYVLKYRDRSAVVAPDSNVILCGSLGNAIDGRSFGVYLTGTFDNLTLYTYHSFGYTLSLSDVVADYTAVSGYDDVINLNSISFDITAVSGETTASAEQLFTYFLVPYEVTAVRAEPLNDGAAAIILAIPLVVIVSVILAAIAFFMRSRF